MYAPGVQIKRGKRAVKPKSLHLLISTSLIPLIVLQASIAQIKIKERVEIKPEKKISTQQSVAETNDIIDIEASWTPASVGRLFADGYETQCGGNGHISISVPMPKKTEGCYYSHFVDLQIQIGTVLPQITHATLRVSRGGKEVFYHHWWMPCDSTGNDCRPFGFPFHQSVLWFDLYPPIARFNVIAEPDTVYKGDYFKIKVIGVDDQDQEVSIDPDCYVVMSIKPDDLLGLYSRNQRYGLIREGVKIYTFKEPPSGSQDCVIDIISGIAGASGTGKITVMKKQAFDHFKVTLTKDTLKNRETAGLTVIAVDKNNNEVSIDPSLLINLTFEDLNQYVDFISAEGDTVDELTNVPYATLRQGIVKVIARGTQPGPVIASNAKMSTGATIASESGVFRTDFPSTKIQAVMAADVLKLGYCDIIIKPEIKVIAVADSIRPYYPGTRHHPQPFIDTTESRTDIKVAVTVSGILYSNSSLPYRVDISSYAVNGSGGHSLGHVGYRPTGLFIEGADTMSVLNKQTTGDTIRGRYQASFFGGKEKIFARLIDLIPVIADTDSVVVRIQNLVPLPSGTNNLINYTSALASPFHCRDSSNYGKQNICDSIVSAVRGYAEELGLENDIFLAAVDMSLPFGGKFEIRGNWESGSGPHEYHRLGKSVDFSYTYRDNAGAIIKVNYFDNDELIKTTDRIDDEKLDNHFNRRGFDRWERRAHKIHYEARN